MAIEMQSYYQVDLPINDVESLKNKFNISDNEVRNLLTSLIRKAVEEEVHTNDNDVFSEDECKELEENLKGLGYI